MNLETTQASSPGNAHQLKFMNLAELRQHAPARLNIKETLAILRIGAATFYRLIDRDEIPGVFRIGGRTFVDRDQLLDWMDACIHAEK